MIVSLAGVLLVEYIALIRLVPVLTGWNRGPVTWLIGATTVVLAPVALVNPDAFYSALLQASLVALWFAQGIVFVVYPRWAIRNGQHAGLAWPIASIGALFAGFGLWSAAVRALGS